MYAQLQNDCSKSEFFYPILSGSGLYEKVENRYIHDKIYGVTKFDVSASIEHSSYK